MRPKHQRLVLALLAIAAIGGASVLAMAGLRDQASYFYAPSDAAKAQPDPGRVVRLGGMVRPGSLTRLADGVSIRFVVSDGAASVPVAYRGVTPDLFREGSGVVAEGRFLANRSFVASNLLAKHDERYMPPQAAGTMHKSESVAR